MKDFASEERPLRASQLYKLTGCPLSQVLAMMSDEDESGPAADTGSAMHHAAHIWHTSAAKDARVALGVMKANVSEYPQADMDRAEEFFRYYIGDVRNQQAEFATWQGKPCSEQAIRFKLPPCQTDPTQAPVWIRGTLDQIRRINGQLVICDIKTGGRHDGQTMLDYHAMQLAAYQIGASELLGEPVRGAMVLRIQDYELYKTGPRKGTPKGPVFWQAAWRHSDCLRILDGVRRTVALVRAGITYANPTAECKWCPQVSVANCVGQLATIGVNRTN